MAEDDARALTQAVNNLTRVVTNLDELLRRDYPKRAEIERRFVSKERSRRVLWQFGALGLLVLAQSVFFTVQQHRQQVCFEGKLAELSSTSSQRADLAERDSAQNKALWSIYAEAAGIIKDPKHPQLSPADRNRLNAELVQQLLTYKKVESQIEADRGELPVHPYTPGSCG